jgi:ATP-dependent Zn protease
VFIDEIDGIGSRNGESGEGARIINAFLTELDGFRERNMLVIGTTNRYEALDEALVRLGGRAAEELIAEPSDGVQSDFEHATYLAANMIRLGLAKGNIMSIEGETDKEFALRHQKEIEDILQDRMKSVQKLLLEHRAFLSGVVEALETQKLLFEADVISIRTATEDAHG